jgi:hypothetical protein
MKYEHAVTTVCNILLSNVVQRVAGFLQSYQQQMLKYL